MPENIVKSRSSLEEIEKKRRELARLENELAEAELARATLENELSYFERRYNARVGALLVELDELNAQIAGAVAVLAPQDDHMQENAAEAREQAKKSFNEARSFFENQETEQESEKFIPTENIKKLYREIAKKIHPDLAKDDADRERRSQYMKEANQAYHDGNVDRLMEILREWEHNPENESENYLEAELERLNRLIMQLQRKIREIEDQIKLFKKSEIGQLKIKADLAEEEEQDLLSQIALEIQAQINKKHKRILSALRILTQPD